MVGPMIMIAQSEQIRNPLIINPYSTTDVDYNRFEQ